MFAVAPDLARVAVMIIQVAACSWRLEPDLAESLGVDVMSPIDKSQGHKSGMKAK